MLNVRHILLPSLLLIFADVENSRGQVVHGTVVDDEARQPVVDAEVVLLAEGQDRARTSTDSVGRFSLRAPGAGTYSVQVSHAAFLTHVTDTLSVGTGETLTLEIRLGRNVVPLQPLRVTARRTRLGLAGFDARRRAGFGQYLTREDIDSRRATRVTDLLRGVRGLSFRPASRNRMGTVTLMTGGAGGRCQPTLWIDDVLVQQTEHSTLDQILTPAVVEAVEVYTSSGTAPPQYMTDSCGVILFWTRQGGGEGGDRFNWKKVLAGAGVASLLIFLLTR